MTATIATLPSKTAAISHGESRNDLGLSIVVDGVVGVHCMIPKEIFKKK